jgi:hypothetical protein
MVAILCVVILMKENENFRTQIGVLLDRVMNFDFGLPNLPL